MKDKTKISEKDGEIIVRSARMIVTEYLKNRSKTELGKKFKNIFTASIVIISFAKLWVVTEAITHTHTCTQAHTMSSIEVAAYIIQYTGIKKMSYIGIYD